MKRGYALITAAIILAGCASGTARLDDATGTAKEERCAGYRTGLAVAKALPESEDRTKRIAVYEALLSSCPVS